MVGETLDKDLQELNPIDVRWYAVEAGWQPVTTTNSDVILLRHPTHELRQIILPTSAIKDDNLRMLEEAVRILAEDARRPVQELVKELLLPPGDVIRLRLRGDVAESGTVPLASGLQLIQSGRDLLLAAASSAHSRLPFFPRQSYKPALEFLNTCRLGQTDRGSFVATILAPVPVASPSLFGDQEEEDLARAPFARKATMLLMGGVASIRKVLDQSAPERAVEHIDEGVSANLCEALTELKINDPQANLEIGLQWSRTRPRVPALFPTRVAFRCNEFTYIEAAGKNLREKVVRRRERIEGQIITLHAEPANLLESFRGVVTVRALVDGERARVRFELNQPEYLQACNAHRDRRPVVATGVLQRDPKAKLFDLTELREFQVLPPIDAGESSP